MSKALYRTYRSRSFDEVVGQSHVTDLLRNAIHSGKISHAYLLTGPRGTGKTSVARIIAHEVNGLKYSEDPHLDIIEIDAASNRRIDDIRDLRDKVHISPVSAKYKVYIIDEVHMLTGESFNALLKTLEEPPEHAIFILATTEVHKVPATIISRTQRFHFHPAAKKDIANHLADIAQKESIEYDPKALDLIATYAGGSFRDSVSILDQLSGLTQKITPDVVESVLGMAEQKHVDDIITAIEQGNVSLVVEVLEKVENSGVSSVILCGQLSKTLLIQAKKNGELYSLLDDLTNVPRAYDPQLKLIATLVRFAKPKQRKTLATHTQKPHSVAAKPAALKSNVTMRLKSDRDVQATENIPGAKPTKDILKSNDKSIKISKKSGSVFDWPAVLTMIKKHHAPLFSVLSRAEINYDATSDTLTLTFVYALHRKKLENPTYKKQLKAVIYDLFKLDTELFITDTKSALAENAEVKAVAAIMGGGEPISGTI